MAAHHSYIPKTKSFLYLSTLLHEPLAALYPLLGFILAKSLGATPLQIVFFTMLKPVASIFSFYWSELVSQNRQSLKVNLLGAGLLARLPFLFALFSENVWAIIAGSTIYMLFVRAAIPAWMEMIKLNLPKVIREKVFSVSSTLGYAEGALIAIGLGSLLDHYFFLWKSFFRLAMLFGIVGVLIQVAMPLRRLEVKEHAHIEKSLSFKEAILGPWRDCLYLMRTRSDFRCFQWAFMIGGFGLMIIQPLLPIFLAETLDISYRDLMIAYAVCKALGFILSSSLWASGMNKLSTAMFTTLVLIGFALYPLVMILGQFSTLWIFVAYFIYGIAQAGSHLIWHLCGPIFAQEDKSSRYSGVNVMMVGVRGTVGPPIGWACALLGGPFFVLTISSLLCLLGIVPMFYRAPKRLSKVQ